MELIEVTAAGLRYKGSHYKCAVGRGGIGQKQGEGDGITPIGTFKLGTLFYRPDKMGRPRSSLETRALTREDGWCDDPSDDKHYNTQVKLPHADSYENLWRDDEVYDLIVVIEFNTKPVILGAGSCIFMHVALPGYAPTAGCVALNKNDLLELLANIEKATKIKIGQ